MEKIFSLFKEYNRKRNTNATLLNENTNVRNYKRTIHSMFVIPNYVCV